MLDDSIVIDPFCATLTKGSTIMAADRKVALEEAINYQLTGTTSRGDVGVFA